MDNDTTKLAYMRAAMKSLANIHGITFSFMKSLGKVFMWFCVNNNASQGPLGEILYMESNPKYLFFSKLYLQNGTVF